MAPLPVHINNIRRQKTTLSSEAGFIIIIILAISLVEGVQGLTNCNSFPKILGANQGNTVLNQIDVYSDSLAMAGHTLDNALTGQTASSQLPYVAVMSILIPAKFYWAKAFSAKVGATIAGIQFSSDGALLIAHSSSAVGFILILNGATGAVVSTRAYSSDGSFNYDSRIKSMLVSSSPSPVAYVLSNLQTSTTTASCTGQHFFKFDPLTFSSAPIWAKKTLVTKTGATDCGHHGMAFGRTESLLYSFSYQANVCTVTLLDSSGSSKWQYKMQNGSPYKNNLIQYKNVSSTVDMIVVTSGGTYINYNRIMSSSASPYSYDPLSLGYRDGTASASREIRALFIISQTQAVSLVYDTTNKWTDFAKIDFTLKTITNKKTLPLMRQGGMTTGIFVSSTVYYVGSYGSGFIQDQTTTQLAFNTAANQQALVYSSDMTQTTCYQLSTEAAQASIVLETLTISAQTAIYQSSTLTFLSDIAASITIDLIVSANTQVSWCPQIPAFTISTVTQTTSTFSFIANTMTQTLSITPFSASVNCGSQPPTFSYSAIDLSDGLALDSIADLVSISPSTGTMTVAISKPAGTYSIKVIGTLPDLLTQTSAIFTLNIGVAGNNAPTFSATLSDVPVPLNSFYSYQLPTMTDIDVGDTVTLSVVKDSATGLTPIFITLVSSNNTLSIYPTLMSQVKVYTIIVIITDTKTPSQYQFTLTITNLAPIVTSSIPTQVSASFGLDIVYTLPLSQDPEGLPYTTTITSGPSFISILSQTSMRIYPTNCRTDVGTFIIEIKLQDQQPLSFIYSIKLTVQNLPPVFNGVQLQNHTMMVGTTLSYTLPAYHDPEGCPVTVTYEPTTLQSFIMLSNSQFTFTPTQVFQLGDFLITVILTDVKGLASNATFQLTVYSPPKFVGSVTRQMDLMASNQAEYSLPVMPGITDEYVVHTGQLPLFVTFQFPTYTFMPNSLSDLGVFTIQGQLWNTYTFISFQFKINVTNQAPIFVGGISSEPLIVPINSIQTFQLPTTYDREGQSVRYQTYEENKSSLPAFVTFNSSSLTYTISPLLKDTIGSYQIKVVLIDSFGAQQFYLFSIQLKAQSEKTSNINQNGTQAKSTYNSIYTFINLNGTKKETKQSLVKMIISKITREQQVLFKISCSECQQSLLIDIVKQFSNQTFEVTVIQRNIQYKIQHELISKDISSSLIKLRLIYPQPQNLSITQVFIFCLIIIFRYLIFYQQEIYKEFKQHKMVFKSFFLRIIKLKERYLHSLVKQLKNKQQLIQREEESHLLIVLPQILFCKISTINFYLKRISSADYLESTRRSIFSHNQLYDRNFNSWNPFINTISSHQVDLLRYTLHRDVDASFHE